MNFQLIEFWVLGVHKITPNYSTIEGNPKLLQLLLSLKVPCNILDQCFWHSTRLPYCVWSQYDKCL